MFTKAGGDIVTIGSAAVQVIAVGRGNGRMFAKTSSGIIGIGSTAV